eukprot:Mrub_00207.p1 GENE.Mrub_00207~~Mrub_00207.p1  ORF type:complete len:1374 (-),score=202.18 Mrub_00207:89-3793(-)
MYQKQTQDGKVIDYHYFKQLLYTSEQKLKQIKINNLNKVDGYDPLRSTKMFREKANSKILTNDPDNNNKYLNYLESTKLYNISQKLVEIGQYSLNVDSVIRDFFYEPDKMYELSSSFLHGQIETLLGFKTLKIINKSDKQVEWTDQEGNLIHIEVRDAPDKLPDTIENKISRKSNKHTPENVPYCVSLIKDFKRNTLIFEKEQDIYTYLNNLQTMFGPKLNQEYFFKEIGLIVRISEVKNGFYGIKADTDSGDYRDLKIIYEMMYVGSEIVMNLESQLNLGESLLWKEAEHIVYDVIRAEDDLNSVMTKQALYEWMEGSYRVILNIIKYILILAAILLITLTTSYVYGDFLNNFLLIQHANGKRNMSFVRGNYGDNVCTILSDEDRSKIFCLGTDENPLVSYINQNESGKFKSIDNIYSNGNVSLIVQDDNLTIYDRYSKNNIVPYLKNHYSDILGSFINDSDINTFKIKDAVVTSKKVCMVSKMKKAVCIPINFKLVYSTSWEYNCYSTYDNTGCFGNISKVNISEEFESGVNVMDTGPYHACFSNDQITRCYGNNSYSDVTSKITSPQMIAVGQAFSCFLVKGKIKCSGSFEITDEDFPSEDESDVSLIVAGYYHLCYTVPNEVKCTGSNDKGQIDVPEAIKPGVDTITAGEKHTCYLLNKSVTCVGSNDDGQLNIPSDFADDLDIVAAGFRSTCLVREMQLKCFGWGHYQDTMPSTLSNKIDSLKIGKHEMCMSINNKLRCYGANDQGQTTVPDTVKYINNPMNISIEEVGLYITKKTKVNTYGYGRTRNIPREFTYEADIIESGYTHTCMNKQGYVGCFGDNYRNNLNIPTEFNGGIDIMSLGNLLTCMKNSSSVQCFGENANGESEVPDFYSTVTLISAGANHVCMATSIELECWGLNNDGQTVLPAAYWRDDQLLLAAGGYHTCMGIILTETACFGLNDMGQTVIPSEYLSGAEVIGAGHKHTCIGKAGMVSCFGSNQFQQINVPEKLSNSLSLKNDNVTKIATNEVNTCFIYDDAYYCAGYYSGVLSYFKEKEIEENVNKIAGTSENDVTYLKTDDQNNEYLMVQSDTGMSISKDINIQLYNNMMCMIYDFGTSFLCYVEYFDESRVNCKNLDSDLTDVVITAEQFSNNNNNNWNVFSNNDEYAYIVKLECGESHVCAQFNNGSSLCAKGSLIYHEGNVGRDKDTLDIYAGSNKTCIKDYETVICYGKEIRKNLISYDLKKVLNNLN